MAMVINESSIDIGETDNDNMFKGMTFFSNFIKLSFKKFEAKESAFEVEASI
jgi:hypothetical protein